MVSIPSRKNDSVGSSKGTSVPARACSQMPASPAGAKPVEANGSSGTQSAVSGLHTSLANQFARHSIRRLLATTAKTMKSHEVDRDRHPPRRIPGLDVGGPCAGTFG